MHHGPASATERPLLDQTRSAVERVVTANGRIRAFLDRVNGSPPATAVAGAGTDRPAEPAPTPPYRAVLSDLHDQLGGLEVLLGDLEQIG